MLRGMPSSLNSLFLIDFTSKKLILSIFESKYVSNFEKLRKKRKKNKNLFYLVLRFFAATLTTITMTNTTAAPPIM